MLNFSFWYYALVVRCLNVDRFEALRDRIVFAWLLCSQSSLEVQSHKQTVLLRTALTNLPFSFRLTKSFPLVADSNLSNLLTLLSLKAQFFLACK